MIIHGEMNHTSAELKQKLPRVAISPILLNSILNKCNVQALILSQDINLPPPIPLPKVQMSRPAAASPVPAKEEKKEQKKK